MGVRIGKAAATVVGVLAIITGIGLTVAGGLVTAVTGGDGRIDFNAAHISTDGVAVVAGDIEIDEMLDDGYRIGLPEVDLSIETTSTNDTDVFVGVAARDDIDSYLAGAARADITGFDRRRLDVASSSGNGQVAPPGDQDFWVSVAEDGRLDWDMDAGSWAIVALNEDGSAGIEIDVEGTIGVALVRVIGITVLAVGIASLLGGALLVYLGVRARRDFDPTVDQPPSGGPSSGGLPPDAPHPDTPHSDVPPSAGPEEDRSAEDGCGAIGPEATPGPGHPLATRGTADGYG